MKDSTSEPVVVITRPGGQGEELRTLLDTVGIRSVLFPTIRIEFYPLGPESQTVLDEVVSEEFDWLIFTSANGVRGFSSLQHEADMKGLPRTLRIGVQGPGTSAVFEEAYGRAPSLLPPVFVAEAFAKAFVEEGVKGKRVLLVVAAKTRDVLAPALLDAGASVKKLAVYATVPSTPSDAEWEKLEELSSKPLLFAFFSPSAFTSALAAFKSKGKLQILQSSRIISIGPVTSRAVEDAGFKVALEARDHSLGGVVKAVGELVKIPY